MSDLHLVTGLAEAAGLGITFVIGNFVGPLRGEATDAATVVRGALAGVLFGTILEDGHGLADSPRPSSRARRTDSILSIATGPAQASL